MTNYEILKNSIFDSIIYLIIFSILSFIVFQIWKRKEKNKDEQEIELDNKNDISFFGFEEFKDAEQFQKDANEIMKLVDDGQQVRVPFAKAMYILKNFKNYDVFSSEDKRIVFDKLKKIIDDEVELDQSKIIDKNIEIERIQTTSKPFDITNEKLEDGSIKVYNPNGYTIMRDSLIVSCVNYADEIKKLEHEKKETSSTSKIKELEEKIKSFEDILLNNNDEVKKVKRKNNEEKKNSQKENISQSENDELINDNFTSLVEVKKVPEVLDVIKTVNKEDTLTNISNELNNEVDNFFENFENDIKTEISSKDEIKEISTEISSKDEIKEISTVQETQIVNVEFKRKSFDNIKNTFPLLEDNNLVFILQSFDVEHKDRVHLFVKWLMDYNNLADLENGFLFVDMDLDKNILYVDMYLFLFLFSNFYADKKNLLNIFTISNQVVDVISIKKLMTAMNYLLSLKYNNQFFKFVGKSDSPFSERVITYDIEGKKIFSSQMIMINLEIEEEEFESNIHEIKTHLIGRFRPQIHKAKFNNEKSEKVNTLGYDYFKHFF